MFKYLVFLVTFIFTTNLYSTESYKFSMVSIRDKESSLTFSKPFTDFLSEILTKKVSFVFIEDHRKLVDAFIKGEVDIAYIGPFPFVILLSKFGENVEPIAKVREKDGKTAYRCVLFTTIDKAKSPIKKLALTNPISTCGYVAISHLLKKRKIDIEKLEYRYIGNHEEVVKIVLAGLYDAGGVKEEVFEKFKGIGLYSIDYSDELPGFIIVANKRTVSSKDIGRMKEILIKASPETFSKFNLGRYGFVSYRKEPYENFSKMITSDMIKKLYE